MAISCLYCKKNTIEQVVQDNLTMYFCKTCNRLYERVLDTMQGQDVIINTDKGVRHVTAGGFIHRGNQFLLLKRRAYPFGYTFPAGHVQYSESPVEAVKREVFEETGLRINETSLLYEGVINSRCRYGGDSHIWHFYECHYQEGIPFLNPESESIGWYTKDEAHNLNLIPAAKLLLHEVVDKIMS